MKKLQLAPTIRTAHPDEVPQSADILERIEKSKTANIVEGFTFQYNESHNLPFKFFAEVNMDNPGLWSLFKALLLQLPEKLCAVYNYKDGDPLYSNYADKYEVLNILENLQLELTQDGFLEAGVLYNDEEALEEVFIKSPKYLQIWSSNEEQFRETMADFELPEIAELEFIDQYPLVTESLRTYNLVAKETDEVLLELGSIGQFDPSEG